jgi:hypothetical protein
MARIVVWEMESSRAVHVSAPLATHMNAMVTGAPLSASCRCGEMQVCHWETFAVSEP